MGFEIFPGYRDKKACSIKAEHISVELIVLCVRKAHQGLSFKMNKKNIKMRKKINNAMLNLYST